MDHQITTGQFTNPTTDGPTIDMEDLGIDPMEDSKEIQNTLQLGIIHILRKHFFGFFGPTHPLYKQIMLIFSLF